MTALGFCQEIKFEEQPILLILQATNVLQEITHENVTLAPIVRFGRGGHACPPRPECHVGAKCLSDVVDMHVINKGSLLAISWCVHCFCRPNLYSISADQNGDVQKTHTRECAIKRFERDKSSYEASNPKSRIGYLAWRAALKQKKKIIPRYYIKHCNSEH